jgi:glucokinase
MNVLAGDVGGTNARLAMVEVADGRAVVRRQQTYLSAQYPELAPIVRAFCGEVGTRPARACIGMACPVVEDECRATNLPWRVDARTLGADTGIPRVAVINDFRAVGYGLALLDPADLVTLQRGEPKERAPIALIGAGTGLGEAFLLWCGDHYEVFSSEGGHGDFAPRDEREAGLARFLRQQYGHASRERVVSGPGIAQVYRYLASTGVAPEQTAVRAELEREDPAAVITRHALAGTDPLSQLALDLFVNAFGAQAGNLALTVLARGGVYLAGGIAPRIVSKLGAGGFLRAFRDKGRMSDFLATVPVHVITNPQVGLLGAAAVAARLP